MDTRAQLVALLNAKVLSGGRRTTAQYLRDYENAVVQSVINIIDDKDQNGGYLGIDSNGRVDISFITAVTPVGDFLRDDGTWSSVLTSAPNLQAVLGAGNNTGGNDILVEDADSIYVGNLSKGRFRYNLISSRVELINTDSGDLMRLDDVGGYRVVLSSGQFMALESGQFLVQGNTAGTAYLQSSSSDNQMIHPTKNTFLAPLHDFNGASVRLSSQTAMTVPYLDANKDFQTNLFTVDVSGVMLFPNNRGIDSDTVGGVYNICSTNASVVNIGTAGGTVNIFGAVNSIQTTNTEITDALITLNKGGTAGSGLYVGFEIEENALITGYWKTTAGRDGYVTRVPAIAVDGVFDYSTLTSDRTWTLPDATGTFVLSSTLASTGFVQGGNAFGATAVLGTTDNYDLNFITNNTTVARFTAAGAFETNGGNGTSSDVAIHQSASNAAGTGRVIDIYNNSYSKLLFRATDNGSAGEIYLGGGIVQINTYTPVVNLYANTTAARGQVSGGDHLAVLPPTGIGGFYFSDQSGNPRLYIQNASAVTVAEIVASGVSYLSGGGFDIRAAGGSGYMGYTAQSSNASAPSAAGFRLFAGATGSFNWVRNNGVSDTYVRTFDATLTADRTYTLQDVAGTVTLQSGTLTSGRLAYVTTGGLLVDSANGTYNGTQMVLTQSTNGSATYHTFTNSSSGTAAISGIAVSNSSSVLNLQVYGTGYTDSGNFRKNTAVLSTNGAGGMILYCASNGANEHIYFYTNAAERGRMDVSGNFVVGTSPSTTRALTVTRSTAGAEGMLFENRDTGSTGRAFAQIKGQAGSLFLYMDSTAGTYGTLANAAIIDATGASSPLMYNVATGNSHTFRINYVEKAKIDSTGMIVAAGTSSTASLAYFVPNDATSNILKLTAYGSAQAGNYGSSSLTVADRALIEAGTTGAKNLIISATAVHIFSGAGSGTAVGMRISSTGMLIANGNVIHNAASAPLHIIKTTEQARIAYDSSNYLSMTVNSTGNITLALTGTTPKFTFSQQIIHSAPERLMNYTVATLPAGVQGDLAYVTDANAPTFLGVIAGGGAVKCPVFYDGTNWVAV